MTLGEFRNFTKDYADSIELFIVDDGEEKGVTGTRYEKEATSDYEGLVIYS